MSSTTSAVDPPRCWPSPASSCSSRLPRCRSTCPPTRTCARGGHRRPTFQAFAARVEYRFGLSVPDAQWPGLGTLAEVAAYVVERARRTSRESLASGGRVRQPEPDHGAALGRGVHPQPAAGDRGPVAHARHAEVAGLVADVVGRRARGRRR